MAATVVEKAFCVLEIANTNSVTLVLRHFRRRYGKLHLQGSLSMNRARNFKKLKQRISTAVTRFDEGMLRSVWTELDYRIDICRVTKAHT